MTRYTIPADEGYEPGSNNQVLKNHLGITSRDEIEEVEQLALKRVEESLLSEYDEFHQFTAQDICYFHEQWLKEIYPFAGKYRSVNMEKQRFRFASAMQISRLMEELERNYLAKYTPCQEMSDKELAHALGIVHVELVLIHPFREGNGRTARLLADLMSLQAGKDTLDYSLIDQTQNEEGFYRYIEAIHAGLGENYEHIERIFFELIHPKTI